MQKCSKDIFEKKFIVFEICFLSIGNILNVLKHIWEHIFHVNESYDVRNQAIRRLYEEQSTFRT